ncbi:unnamed protein product [Cutaneotrichosporon oleaginosum]
MRWYSWLIGIALVGLLVTRVALPWAVRFFSSFRFTASELSPLRVRGLEWRMKGQAKTSPPTLRIELINWSLGGPAAPGKLSLNVQGITYRNHKKRSVNNSDAPHSKKVPSWAKPVVDYLLHLLLHQWITVAGFLSVHITDVRVILEKLDDLEIRISDGRLAFGQDVSIPPAHRPPLQPDEDNPREGSPASDEASGTPRARRHAPSPSLSQMSKAVWSHAIGNAIGRMAFSLRVHDVAVLLPRSSSVTAERPSEGPHTPFASLNSVLRNRKRKSKVDSTTTRRVPPGYERIVCLDSPSHVLLSLGIGPATQVFDKDNLRVDVRLGNAQLGVGGLEKVIAINKAHRKLKNSSSQGPSRLWAEGSAARRVVRALEYVTVSCEKGSAFHVLPLQQLDIPSTSSAASEASETSPPGHTLALEVSSLSMRLGATHSGMDPRLGNIFGTSQKKSSRVHGITASLSWSAVGLQCMGPGEAVGDQSQLFAIRRADFDVLTTWAPEGFERREALFSDDPELSIVIARGCVASLDLASDLQLTSELARSWIDTHPVVSRAALPPSAPRTHWPKPPRVRLFVDLGRMSMMIANSAAEDSATISLTSEGISLGVTANIDDHGATSSQTDEPVSPSSGDDASSTSTQALDEERPTFGMVGDGFVTIEPISLHISLGTQSENTYKLAKIGRVQTKVIGHISGTFRTLECGLDDYRLLPNTLVTDVEVLIDEGVKFQVWHPDVIKAITDLAKLKPASSLQTHKPRRDLLDVLPGGLSVRLALGAASIFIGHQDVHPLSTSLLARGIWLQTAVVIDYARFRTMKASGSAQHLKNLKMRDRLKLFKDVTASAFDHTHKLKHRGAQAALFSLLLRETAMKTVFNGEIFVENGGTDRCMPASPARAPLPEPADPEFVAWGWSGSRRREKAPRELHLSHAPRTYLSPSHLLYVPHLHFTAKVHQPVPHEPSHIQVYGRVELVHIENNISDLYCALLAVHTVATITKALKRSGLAPTSGPSTGGPVSSPVLKSRIPITIGLAIHKVWVHFHFPLQEQAFLALENVGVERDLERRTIAKSDYVVLYIPSDTQPGMWDELGRIKRLTMAIDVSHAVKLNAIAFRIRIPYAFIFSQLIFNINMTIKTVKLLLSNLRSHTFSLYKKPVSESPKKLPHINIQVDLVHFEARDHPVENKLNLANRVGLHEQKTRLDLDELFEQKLAIMAEDEDSFTPTNLSRSQSVTDEEARYRLDWHNSRNWVRRIRRAKAEQRRREESTQRRLLISPSKLPIPVLPLEQTVPLFRFAFVGVNVTLAAPDKSRAQLIKYMGDVSAPFKDDVEFSLMVPFDLSWTMMEAKVQLRDYPLPLLRILPGPNKTPGWDVTTLFIIAEELSDDDSTMFFPIEVVPGQCGHEAADPLTVNIGKAIMPTKTYARPMIKVRSHEATRITWCNSYKPGMSDLTRIFETLSNPPLDPSSKPGFWDKLRLAFHWRVIIDFAGTVRWYIKGSQNPYSITGFGAGFALVWRRNVCIEIGQPNAENELVQVMADELLVSIPDLNELQDQAALGVSDDQPEMDEDEADRRLIERRSTKPCARFLNGVRFGLGFVFERTCRPWSCDKCGNTLNLLHRQCRIFDFRPHNTVVLKHPKVAERLREECGHEVDSYEGFRSDYIHFSVSLVAPREAGGVEPTTKDSAAATHSSIHMNPKAFAHFFNWWSLFRSKIPSPIRQGRAFPDTPPSSSKFGASLATIKYRCDIAPIYVSHMYSVSSEEMWSKGLAQSLGLKLRSGRFRLDGHQRQQEQRQYSEALKGVKIVTHKPFYACDLLLDDITFKGMVADFNEAHISSDNPALDRTFPHASDLSDDGKVWYNYFDFIDADQKPFDRNPRMQIVHMGDCPHVFLSRRVKVLPTKPNDEGLNLPPGKEASKFGHEKTHICYLGAALDVGPMQSQIAQERVVCLLETLDSPTEEEKGKRVAALHHRIDILKHHIDELAHTETRHMDNSTLGLPDAANDGKDDGKGETIFDNTVHIHNPRLFFNNESRNVFYKYLYARTNRKREEYTSSYAALRAIRDGVNQRRLRAANGLNRDDVLDQLPADEVAELLRTMEKWADGGLPARFKIDDDFLAHQGTLELPERGLPADCAVHPKWRVLVLKPQIALRSTADPAAVVLVTLEEMAMKGYVIIDSKAADSVVSEVLSRSFAACKGLQVFYPTAETMERSIKGAPNYREMDFVPLEIFLDAKSEATDYDRIILRSDMAITWDEFNHLRAPRGLEWPDAVNEFGDSIEHLRLHQNMTSVCMPTLIASANPDHWTALYYIITDLLMYNLPEKRSRKQKVDGFLLKFDRRDRDPQQLLWNLFVVQQHMRGLAELQRGYQANLQRLTPEGKRELFNIRADLLQEYETLNTVFDVINLNRSYEEARDALQTKSRIDVRLGNIAWHMIKDDGNPLVKLNMKHAVFAMDHNQDGSMDMATAVADLEALNSNTDALFHEVLTKSSKELGRKKMHSSCFVSASFSTLPEVGGISIIKEMAAYLHPVRFRLEQKVGVAVMDYIFNDKTKPRKGGSGTHHDKVKPEKTKSSEKAKQSEKPKKSEKGKHPAPVATARRSTDSLPLPRNQSQMTVASAHSAASIVPQADITKSDMDMDAEEMRRRASQNHTFMSIMIGSTSLVLDYKRDETRKKHGFVVPEVADFKLTTPELTYKDEVWSGKDCLKAIMRDLIRSAWSQKGDLVSQVMKKSSVFRSKKHLRHIAGLSTEVDRYGQPKSPLRFSVQPSTPLDMDDFEPLNDGSSYSGTATTASNMTASTEDTITPRNVRNMAESTITPRTGSRRGSLGTPNGNGSGNGNGNADGGDADDEGDAAPKSRRTGLFGRLRKQSKGEEERAIVTPQPRTRLGSVSEGGYLPRMSQTPPSQRTASTEYNGGASLRSSRSAQSPSSRLAPEVVRRQVSNGD